MPALQYALDEITPELQAGSGGMISTTSQRQWRIRTCGPALASYVQVSQVARQRLHGAEGPEPWELLDHSKSHAASNP